MTGMEPTPRPVGRAADPYREWDAAYVLGALGPAERRAYEEHLAGCAACREAVAELAGMPGLLSSLPPEHALALLDDTSQTAASADIVPFSALAARARRHRARRRSLALVAAVALVVGGVVTGLALGSAGPEGEAPGGVPSSGTVAEGTAVELEPVGAIDVRATLTATPRPWGTQLEWSCSYPARSAGQRYDAAEPVAYELVLVDRDGGRTVAATWSASGTESRGLSAASAVPLDDVARVEIAVAGGQALAAAEL
ncbi:anti-sigma factor [Isoptericola variabilis]|uniref:Putative transmembrane anti-sigma factor n=1 Tax=Isoptericola variabilis (strain 225) TaxID=743718 RepID=F6FW50_ISOV2|nr:zf-HC2 domain-containing protein [Isoptericola variabilis]AEG45594.1 putative transmembrane anti-sigma factor [Isoptericola variabilis 225]TWH25798.1 putative zinc finger protein [Isoptericola variabilis J7]